MRSWMRLVIVIGATLLVGVSSGAFVGYQAGYRCGVFNTDRRAFMALAGNGYEAVVVLSLLDRHEEQKLRDLMERKIGTAEDEQRAAVEGVEQRACKTIDVNRRALARREAIQRGIQRAMRPLEHSVSTILALHSACHPEA